MHKKSILIIEDSEIDVLILSHALGPNFELHFAASAEVAMCSLAKETFDLILLDIALPGVDGLEFCKKIKLVPAYEATPIIFVSGCRTVEERVAGLQAGADDFISKPFAVPELLARIGVCLRRLPQITDEKSFLKCGPLILDYQKHCLVLESAKDSFSIGLTSTELKLLSYFLKRPNVICTRAQIIDEVWGKEVHVLERTVDARVNAIRKKMGTHANLLNAVHGVGYKLAITSLSKVS